MKKIVLISVMLVALFFLLYENGSGPNVSQNGISTIQLADEILSKYDQNNDGILDVTDESFLRIETDGIIKVESHGLLFTDADRFGHADGSVTEGELIAYLDEFDTDSDGEITTFKNIFDSLFNGKSEWAKFDDQYGERFGYDNK